jgi:hypothetical protein
MACHARGDIMAVLLGEALGDTLELPLAVGAVSCLGVCGTLGSLAIDAITDRSGRILPEECMCPHGLDDLT